MLPFFRLSIFRTFGLFNFPTSSLWLIQSPRISYLTFTMRRRRKLYYPVGLFSLSLLPMFCIWCIDKRGVFDDLRALEITWWNKDWYGYVQNPPNFDVHPRREFIDIYLTGNAAEDKVKLDFAQLAIRELVPRTTPSKEYISTSETRQNIALSYKHWIFLPMKKPQHILLIKRKYGSLTYHDYW